MTYIFVSLNMPATEIQQLTDEINVLRSRLKEKEERLRQLKLEAFIATPYSPKFSSDEIIRYSRQIIMPQYKLSGQIALKNGKVLIIGAGGLGCPSSIYLAAAGVGEIHIVDHDVVELSNLHRQILHYEYDIKVPKAESIRDKLLKINSNILVFAHKIHVDSTSIIDLLKKYEFNIVLDCTDNVPTRYLLNDICVFNNIPLVSGSALQMEGQLTVYNYNNGPCYRCLFPVPPPANTVTNCGDGGVLGAVPGAIGVLQALEALKILTKQGNVLSGRLLLFDAEDAVFRNVKLRNKSPNCDVCGDNPKITAPIDYEQFCGSRAHDKVINIDILSSDQHIDVKSISGILNKEVVIDVRPVLEYEMARLPNTVNIPYSDIQSGKAHESLQKILNQTRNCDAPKIYVLCRRGNDSQRSVAILTEQFKESPVMFINIKGGLYAYSKYVDSNFPVY